MTGEREPTLINTYFATALVSAQSVGVTICAENIGRAFEVAKDHLLERNPRSEVIVQAVQRINREFTVHSQRADNERNKTF
jgi:hypothetical protein